MKGRMNLDDFDAAKSLLPSTARDISTTASQEHRHVQLPEKFRILLEQVKSLMVNLTTLKRRRQVPNFERIREVVEKDSKHSFTRDTLSKVLTIIPEGTIIPEWKEDNRKNLPHKLILQFCSTNPVNEILEYAHDQLCTLVIDAHTKYCIEKNIRPPRDLLYLDVNFDINTVPDVEPTSLKQPIILDQATIFESFLPKVPPKPAPISLIPENIEKQEIKVPKSCQNLNNYFRIAKEIREKASYNTTLREIANNRTNENILKVIDIMNIGYNSAHKTVYEYFDMMEIIKRNKAFSGFDRKRLELLIDDSIARSDGYFEKTSIGNKSYIKLNKQKNFKDVRGPIYRALYQEV